MTKSPFPLIRGWKGGQVNVKVTPSDPLSCLFLRPGLQSPAEKPTVSHIQRASGLPSHPLGHSWGAAGPLVPLWLTHPLILSSDFTSLLGTLPVTWHSCLLSLLAQSSSTGFLFMKSLGHLFKFNEGHMYCTPTVCWMALGLVNRQMPV